jgi:predicted adenylyl cyclase CyaB
MSGLPFEIEVKARVADHAALRAALDSGATFVKEIEKADVYFADARLSAAEVSLDRDRVFRIRDVGGACEVTFKERTLDGAIERNVEGEFPISDPAAFRAFAAYIGFRPIIEKRKRTRLYQVGPFNVELNEVPPLGWFLEVELVTSNASDPAGLSESLLAVLDQFGVARDAVETTPYIVMLRDAAI